MKNPEISVELLNLEHSHSLLFCFLFEVCSDFQKSLRILSEFVSNSSKILLEFWNNFNEIRHRLISFERIRNVPFLFLFLHFEISSELEKLLQILSKFERNFEEISVIFQKIIIFQKLFKNSLRILFVFEIVD